MSYGNSAYDRRQQRWHDKRVWYSTRPKQKKLYPKKSPKESQQKGDNWNAFRSEKEDYQKTPPKQPIKVINGDSWKHVQKDKFKTTPSPITSSQKPTTSITPSPKKLSVWTSKSPDTFVNILKKRTANIEEIGYIDDNHCLFKPAHKDLAEICTELLRKYRALCKKRHVVPNKRILTTLWKDKYAENKSIELQLSGAGLQKNEKIFDTHIIPLFDAIESVQCEALVTEIDISDNMLKDNSMNMIAAFLSNNPHIRKVNFYSNRISVECAMRIARALATTYVTHRSEMVIANGQPNTSAKAGKTLGLLTDLFRHAVEVTIRLKEYFYQPGCTENMQQTCKSTTIKELRIDGVRQHHVTEEMMSILESKLKHLNRKSRGMIRIDHLHLTMLGDGVTVTSSDWIVKRLKDNHVLKILDLSNCNLDYLRLRQITHALGKSRHGTHFRQSSTSLEKLSLAGNNFGASAGALICQLLEWNCTLIHLDVRRCGLMDEALYMVGNMLGNAQCARHLRLKTLLMSGNTFGTYATNMWKHVLYMKRNSFLETDFWDAIKSEKTEQEKKNVVAVAAVVGIGQLNVF